MLNSIIVVFFLIGIISIYFIQKRKNFLNPSSLFSIIILGTFFLDTLRFSRLQKEYPVWFILEIISLCLFFFFGSRIRIRKRNQNKKIYYIQNYKMVCFVLWIAIVIAFVITVIKLGLPPAISKSERANYFISGWGTIILLYQLLFGMVCYDFYTNKILGKMGVLYIITSILVSVSLANKYQMICLLLLFFVARNSFYKRINIKHVAIVIIAVLAIFTILYKLVYYSMYGVSMEAMYNGYQMIIPKELSFITAPYLYIVFNYQNLYNYILLSEGHTYGAVTFASVLDILGLNDILTDSILFQISNWKYLLRIPSLTTGTLFKDFFMDGGYVWAACATFVCGIWSNNIYKDFLRDKNLKNFYVYFLMISAIVLSFFTNAFTSKLTIVNIIAVIFVDWFLTRKIIIKR